MPRYVRDIIVLTQKDNSCISNIHKVNDCFEKHFVYGHLDEHRHDTKCIVHVHMYTQNRKKEHNRSFSLTPNVSTGLNYTPCVIWRQPCLCQPYLRASTLYISPFGISFVIDAKFIKFLAEGNNGLKLAPAQPSHAHKPDELTTAVSGSTFCKAILLWCYTNAFMALDSFILMTQ